MTTLNTLNGMELKDPIYLEMMAYYDSKSRDFDNYWKRDLYPDTEENRLLFHERNQIDSIAKLFGNGNCIDLGCGTSHWLPYYYVNCSQITFVDQSKKMLDISKEKSINLNHSTTTFSFIESDVFELNIRAKFDSLILGNLLGHLTDSMVALLMARIASLLDINGEIFITDSLIHSGISNSMIENNIMVREVVGKEYRIYKRYFTKKFIEKLLKKSNYEITSNQFWGKYFFGFIAIKNG